MLAVCLIQVDGSSGNVEEENGKEINRIVILFSLLKSVILLK